MKLNGRHQSSPKERSDVGESLREHINILAGIKHNCGKKDIAGKVCFEKMFSSCKACAIPDLYGLLYTTLK